MLGIIKPNPVTLSDDSRHTGYYWLKIEQWKSVSAWHETRRAAVISYRARQQRDSRTWGEKRVQPERMKKMPDTKARMVRWGRMCPMLLMTKAVKTKSRDTIGKGVAVRTISVGAKGQSVKILYVEMFWTSPMKWMIMSTELTTTTKTGFTKSAKYTHYHFIR